MRVRAGLLEQQNDSLDMIVHTKRFSALVLGATALLAPGASGQGMPAARVVLAEATEQAAPATITVVGTVRALRQSAIGSEVGGIVAEMPARQGDFVEQGQVLCRLNDDTVRLQHAAAAARLRALEARHQELLAGSRVEEIDRAKAEYDEARAMEERWRLEWERVENLYRDASSIPKEVWDTRASHEAAQQRTRAYKADYDMAVKGPREEEITRAAFDVEEQRAEVDRLASDLAKTTIRAPYSAYVTELNTEVGEWVAAGDSVLSLIDLHSVLVRADVPEAALPYVSLGDTVRVYVDALQRTFEGTVRHIIRQADPRARTFPVEVEIINEEGLLADGMFTRTTLKGGQDQNFVTVPKDALVERGGVTYVGLVTPGPEGALMAALTPVTVGVDVADRITVTSGNVPAGSQVVVRGNENLLPFPMPIQPVDEVGNPVTIGAEAGAAAGQEGA